MSTEDSTIQLRSESARPLEVGAATDLAFTHADVVVLGAGLARLLAARNVIAAGRTAVEEPGSVCPDDAEVACLVSPQAMMVVLKTMEEQGLVERTQHPRHHTVLEVHLTSVGRGALSAARKRAEPIERRIAKTLSREEIETLRKLLRRCIEAIRDTA